MALRSPRVLGLAAAALVVAGWLLGSTLSPPVAQTQVRTAERAAAAPALSPIVPFTGLASRLPAPAPPSPARNPFVFGRGTAAAEPAAAGASPPVPSVVDPLADTLPGAVAADAADEWRLLGLAVAADGTVTAIVRGQGEVHLARAGDRLAADVVVSDVGETGVRLQRADGSTIALRLP